MTHSPLYLAAVAVDALGDVDIVSTRPPHIVTSDVQIGGCLDSQGRHWVVKLPLHALAGAALEAEAALSGPLMDAVDNGHLPFDVIRPRGYSNLTEGGRAVVYREPFGAPINLENIDSAAAASIGRAIGALHELSPDVYESAGVPLYDAESLRKRLSTDLEEAALSKRVPTSLLARWDRWLETEALWDMTTVPVHGDLDEDNVLASHGSVTAITGFGESHVGDPATDFVWLANGLDDDMFDVVTEAYAMSRSVGGDNYLLERVTLHSEFALAKWLLHGLRIGSTEIVEDAQSMLKELDESILADPTAMAGPRWRVDPTAIDTPDAAATEDSSADTPE